MHPIVSACGTAAYNTAKFITKILQNYCGKTSSFVKDSTDFIMKIKHLSINPEEETLVSFDVSALSTSIPVPAALQVINSKISTCTNFTNVYKIQTVKFIKFLEFTLTNCIFCFNNNFYKQLQGAAMGSHVSLSLQISTSGGSGMLMMFTMPPGKIKSTNIKSTSIR